MTERLQGVVSPNLTPFNDDLSPAEDLYVRHAHWLLGQGCAAVTPFGTTGEALSLGMAERKHLLEALIASGVDPARLMAGTGLTNLPDTADLTRHAAERGCLGAMVLPPFYIKGVSDDGLFRYFEELIRAVPACRIYLYHIPPAAVVGFSVTLAQRLAAAFPDHIIGLKDSGGDFDHTQALLKALPDISIFPGSEVFLLPGLRHGGAGCITATANIRPSAIDALFQTWREDGADEKHAAVCAFREVVQDYPVIPAMKWLLADASGDSRWRNVRPPLEPLSDEKGREMKTRLAQDFGFELQWG